MPPQIEVRGVDGELKAVAEGTLSLKPNFAYTLKEVGDDARYIIVLLKSRKHDQSPGHGIGAVEPCCNGCKTTCCCAQHTQFLVCQL